MSNPVSFFISVIIWRKCELFGFSRVFSWRIRALVLLLLKGNTQLVSPFSMGIPFSFLKRWIKLLF